MELDLQQQAAVESTSRRALVIASAGSGKTRVLTERIAHLIEHCNVSPYEVMSFTFTRKASQEMTSRLEVRIGTSAHKVAMGTMHGIALRMVHRFHELIGLRADTTIYGEWEADFLLKEVARDLGILKGKSWKVPRGNIDRMFSDYYERGIDPGTLPEHLQIQEEALFNAFMKRCRENNAMTYGGLLIALEKLIPAMAKHLRIRHLLVDEIQDIDPLQWRIINGMCEAFGASLFVVGDVDQSIYSFRGAVPEYLVEHQGDFDVYRLEANYRSGVSIVNAANWLIQKNTQRIEKSMVPSRLDGWVHAAPDADSMVVARLASETILRNPQEPIEPGEIGILARNHALLRRLSEEMAGRGVPHTYIGQKTALTNSEEFRRFHAFLKLLVNPYDNFSFLLIRDLVGISPQQYGEIQVKAAEEGKSHFQVWLASLDFPFGTSPNPYAGLFLVDHYRESFLGAVTEIHSIATGVVLSPGGEWPYHVEEIARFVLSWHLANPQGTIQDYLSWLATFDIQDEISEETEGVTLCTIHAAKGVEWPVVILAGCNEGILPSRQAMGSGNIEEERRLMYVAMTRARDELLMTIRPETSESNGKTYHNPVSRFISEAMG